MAKRCVYFDSKRNAVSDQGIITSYNAAGFVQCMTFHLTDFTIEQYDPQESTKAMMKANLVQADVFVPMAIMSTTPTIVTIALCAALGAVIM